MAQILVLHGPNLNLLGQREPEVYGSVTIEQINVRAAEIAASAGFELIARQSNAEHELVQIIQDATAEGIEFIIINPAAYTHTSIAIRDAILATAIPFVEVHLSNVYKREEFRHRSYFSDIAVGVISGLGAQSYEAAVHAAVEFLNKKSE